MSIISLCPQFIVKPQIQLGGGLDMQREISSLFLCTISLSVRDSLKSLSFNYRLDMQRQFSSLLYVHHPSLSPICSKLPNSTKVLIFYFILFLLHHLSMFPMHCKTSDVTRVWTLSLFECTSSAWIPNSV